MACEFPGTADTRFSSGGESGVPFLQLPHASGSFRSVFISYAREKQPAISEKIKTRETAIFAPPVETKGGVGRHRAKPSIDRKVHGSSRGTSRNSLKPGRYEEILRRKVCPREAGDPHISQRKHGSGHYPGETPPVSGRTTPWGKMGGGGRNKAGPSGDPGPDKLLPADHLPGAGDRGSRRWHGERMELSSSGYDRRQPAWGGNPRGREKDPPHEGAPGVGEITSGKTSGKPPARIGRRRRGKKVEGGWKCPPCEFRFKAACNKNIRL